MPRIIAGKARGTQLNAPPGRDTRPTADRTKEALFSILAPRLADARFLDLFAGSGQIGLEALSRGVAEAVFVENERRAVQIIRGNLAKTHLTEAARVMAMSAAAALKLLSAEVAKGTKLPFDIIFLDPPYANAHASLAKLAAMLPLATDGILILEHESNQPAPVNVTCLQLVRSCKYGTAMLSFYRIYDDQHGAELKD